MITTENEQMQDHSLVSVLLWVLSWIFLAIQDMTFESFYVWTFRILSLTSLLMIIVINRKKFWSELLEFIGRK